MVAQGRRLNGAPRRGDGMQFILCLGRYTDVGKDGLEEFFDLDSEPGQRIVQVLRRQDCGQQWLPFGG